MRARPLPARAVVLLLLLLLVSACRGAPEPTPTTPPPPDPTQPDPLALAIEDIQLVPMGNGEILTGTGEAVDTDAAERAVEATASALERFLNAQFVDEGTRFSEGPARALLQPGVFDALPPEQRAAMGVQYQPVMGVLPGRATGTASVLFHGAEVYAVSIDYRVDVELFYDEPEGRATDSETASDDGTEEGTAGAEASPRPLPLEHRGIVVFTAPSWTVESFEFHISAPDVPVPPPAPAPEASAT